MKNIKIKIKITKDHWFAKFLEEIQTRKTEIRKKIENKHKTIE